MLYHPIRLTPGGLSIKEGLQEKISLKSFGVDTK